MNKRGYLDARCKGGIVAVMLYAVMTGVVLELVLRNRAGIVSESHVVHPVISSDYPREPYCLAGSASVVLVELNHLKLRLEQPLQCISRDSSTLRRG